MPKVLLLTIIILLILTCGFSLQKYYQPRLVLGSTSNQDRLEPELLRQLVYWQEVASASPTYRDAWVQSALLSQQLGDTAAAAKYLNKSLEIDPNWPIPTPLLPLLPLALP